MATTPALTRALRAGTLDLAILARRPPYPPPDAESPALELQIVAAGLAITTLAPITLDVLPDGVAVLAVRGEPQETRRIVLARRPGPLNGPVARVADALLTAAAA